jgi:hypothetical protein
MNTELFFSKPISTPKKLTFMKNQAKKLIFTRQMALKVNCSDMALL